MDYGNGNKNGESNYGDTPPNLITDKELNKFKIKKDGQSGLSNKLSDTLNPNLNSIINKENTQMKEKKIANNKPSQFGPVLGVNFHNVKR